MLRVALIMIFIGTMIGAIMPSGSPAPSNGADGWANNRVVAMEAESASSELSDQSTSYREIRLRRAGDGHFYADVMVNGARINFMIDTGATIIALTRADAQRASITLSPDDVDVIGQGAGGELYGEYVDLDRVELGHKQAQGMVGVVVDGGEQSLLGQTFLSKFDSVEIHGDEMTLR